MRQRVLGSVAAMVVAMPAVLTGRDSLIWPREGGLKWPRLRGVAGCRCDGLIWPHLCDTP
jgi:hypothetical protein